MRYAANSAMIFASVLGLSALAGCGGNSPSDPSGRAAINGPNGGAGAANSARGTTSAGQSDEDRLHPRVVLNTSLGSITLRLDAEKAPLTVDNFLGYVDAGHYNQTIFHQVFQGQGILGGGFSADLSEKAVRPAVRNEAHNGLANRRGTIGMVRRADSIDSAACQFYFNVADNDMLDHRDRTPEAYGYCVFGQVVEGMDVVDRIAAVPVHDTSQFERLPVETVLIQSARRAR